MNLGIGSSKNMVSPFFCVTIVSTTILYWTNITLSKMTGYSSKFDEWARRPEAKAKLASAKKNAWEQFTKQFPNADKDQFYVQTNVDENFKISAEVFFNESAGSSVSVFGPDRKYWSQQMKKALGLAGVEGFPFQLSPLKTKIALPIPAVDFTELVPSTAKIFNEGNRIYATPDEFFVAKFRNIFQHARLTHTASAEEKKMAKGVKYGILATTSKLCDVLRYAVLRNFSRNIRQRAFSNTTDKGILPVSRVFHSKAVFVPARRNPEHECFAGAPHV